MKKATLICLAFQFAQMVCAQNYQVLDKINTSNGLLSDETYSTFTTRDGILWICSDQGLSRYDGNSVISYGQKDGLSGSAVFGGVRDSVGHYWLITNGGVSVLMNDSVYTPKFNKDLVAHERYSTIKDLQISEDGTIYLSTVNHNSGFFKIQNNKIEFIKIPLEFIHGCNEQIFVYSISEKSKLYGLLETDFSKACSSEIIDTMWKGHNLTILSDSTIQSGRNNYHFAFDNLNYYFSIRDKGFTYTPSINRLRYWNFNRELYCLNTQYIKYLESSVETVSIGKMKFDRTPMDNMSITDFKKYTDKVYVLCDLFVGVLFLEEIYYSDFSIEEWLNTGIMTLKFNLRNDTVLIHSDGVIHQFSNKDMSYIGSESISRDLYHGEARFKHASWDYNGNVTFSYAHVDQGRKHGQLIYTPINSAGENIRQTLYFGNDYFVSEGRGKVKIFNIGKKCLSEVVALEEDVYCFELLDSFVVIGYSNYFSIYSIDTSSCTMSLIHSSQTAGITAAILVGDSIIMSNDLCSLYVYNVRTGAIDIKYTNAECGERVNSIYLDGDKLLIGTIYRLAQIHVTSEQDSLKVTTLSLLPVHQILGRSNERVTIRSSARLLSVARLEMANCNERELFISKVVINGRERLLYNGAALRVQRGDQILVRVRPSHFFNRLDQEYYFSIVNIDGLSVDWRNSTDHIIMFGLNDEGFHKLRIIGKSNHGICSSSEANLAFFSYYRSTGAFLFFIANITSLGVFAWLGYPIIINHIQLGGNRGKHWRDVVLKFNKVMHPHFLFNILNGVNLLIENNNTYVAKKYIKSVSQQLREMMESTDNIKVQLQAELKRIAAYIQVESERQPGLFEYKVINTVLQGFDKLEIPPMMLQPIFENCINHAFKEMETGGQIQMNLTMQDGVLRIDIMDNGPGYEPEPEKKKESESTETSKESQTTEGTKRESIGLKNIRTRLEALSKLEKRPHYMTFGRTRDNGTVVSLFIPQKRRNDQAKINHSRG